MAIALVQAKKATVTSGTSITVSGLTATTAGNLLVMFVARGAGATDPTYTAPAGWVALGSTQYDDGWNSMSGQAWYYPNNPGGITSVAVTCSAAFSGGALYVLEFSGVATASPLDTHNEAVASSFTTSPSISTTTTTDGDLIVGFVMNDVGHAGGTITEPASPWTTVGAEADDGSGWLGLGGAYQVQTTHGAVTYNPTFSAANDWILWIASFKAAGGGGGSTPLTAQAGLMVLNPPAAATLGIAVALAGQSGKAVLIGGSAPLALAVALASASTKAIMTAPNAALAVAVALSAQAGVAVLAPPGAATLASAVALGSPSAALGVLTAGSAATLGLGGQLVAQAGLMVLAPPPSPATLAVAVRLVSPAPAVAVLTPAAAAALLLAVPLLASAPALAVLDATNATLTIIGLAFVALASLSDATVAGAALADTAISGDTTSDALLASATIGDA